VKVQALGIAGFAESGLSADVHALSVRWGTCSGAAVQALYVGLLNLCEGRCMYVRINQIRPRGQLDLCFHVEMNCLLQRGLLSAAPNVHQLCMCLSQRLAVHRHTLQGHCACQSAAQ
jgi:hypothetical protein